MTTKSQPSRNVLMGILHIALILFFATQLHSCTDEHTDHPTPTGEEKTITFSVKVPGGFTPTSYALSENQENAIETIDVLIFKDGKYSSGPHYASLGTPYNEGGKTYTPVTIRIPDGVDITTSDYSVEVFANSRSIINTAATGFTTDKTRSEVFGMLSVNLSTGNGKWIDATNNPQYATIPMHATLNGATAKADLVRMLARINVKNTPDAMGQFQLKSVHLYNHNTQGYVAATTAGTLNALVSSVASGLTYTTSSNTFENEIYTFETATGSNPAVFTVGNPCLVIGGNYKGDSNKEYYYRVDFFGKKKDSTDPEAYIPLLRNHSYEVSVTKIFGPGYATAALAAASKPINIEYTIQGWDENSIIDAGYNGQYMVGVSASKFNFDKVARTKYSGDNILYIQTDHPSGWTAEITGDGGGIWLKLLDIKTGNVINSSAGLTTPYAFSTSTASPVKLQLEANSGGSRSATIKLKAGNVVCSVAVTQSNQATVYTTFQPESNCYIVKPNSKIFIPVSRANGSPEVGIQLKQADAFTAGLVWTDNTNGIANDSSIKDIDVYGRGANGYVYVETGSGEGNAVVAIKNTSGNILWSWHIWVTRYNPQPTGTQYQNFMDRNLGAFSNGYVDDNVGAAISSDASVLQKAFGLMYQWGRKDPFPGAKTLTGSVSADLEPNIYYGSFCTMVDKRNQDRACDISATNSPSRIPGPVSISTSVQSPDRFISSTNGGDWSSQLTGTFDKRWGAKDDGSTSSSYDTKSVYDPCPPGWRVPIVGAYTGGKTSYKGSVADTELVGWFWDDTNKGAKVDINNAAATGDDFSYSPHAWYPAVGCRFGSYGTFYAVGSSGNYWSASPSGTVAGYYLVISSSAIHPSNDYLNRLEALSVRCLQDL